MKGKNNPRWNNGASPYPDHALLKKNRLKVLEAANYTCGVCGGKADRTHHLDGKKTDHSQENLEAVCNKCNIGFYHKDRKHKPRKFGVNYNKIAKEVGCHCRTVFNHLDKKPSARYGVAIDTVIKRDSK